MTAVETWIAQQIKTDPAVSELLGGRVAPILAPPSWQETWCTYRRAATEVDYHASETSALVKATIEIAIWTEGEELAYARSVEIARRIRQAVKANHELAPTGVLLDAAHWINEYDAQLPPELGDETNLKCRVLVYEVHYYEDVPEK